MTTDYLAGRQNVVQGEPAELNAKLAALAEVFDEAWLKENGSHPLQSLWGRQDALATNELLNFGHAIELLHLESPDWLKAQVRLIKTGDAGQSAGAVFEIIALSLFSRDFCQVIPAPDAMPGFDGTLILKDGARVLVSVKNHGISAREREFLAEAQAFDVEFQAQLAQQCLRDVEVNVLARKHLDTSDFHSLKADIAASLAEIRAGRTNGTLERPYTISVKDMAAQYGPLSAFGTSSCCRIMSPMAKNEQANFEEAIRKGCANLYAHTKEEAADVCRMIILRLSNAASMDRCKAWATWYFKEYPQDPVDAIILYQPAVTTDLARDTSSIVHHVTVITGPRFPQWQRKPDGSQRRLPNMSFYVGLVSSQQSTMLLTDGHASIDLSNYYFYQRADIFQKVEFTGTANATLSNPTLGIMVHAVVEQNGVPAMTCRPSSIGKRSWSYCPNWQPSGSAALAAITPAPQYNPARRRKIC